MTIIAQLNTLGEAYASMEALRARQIPPELWRVGEFHVISVEDDFVETARVVLAKDGHLPEEFLRRDRVSNWTGYDDFNA